MGLPRKTNPRYIFPVTCDAFISVLYLLRAPKDVTVPLTPVEGLAGGTMCEVGTECVGDC